MSMTQAARLRDAADPGESSRIVPQGSATGGFQERDACTGVDRPYVARMPHFRVASRQEVNPQSLGPLTIVALFSDGLGRGRREDVCLLHATEVIAWPVCSSQHGE
jgi:hypothetical protein